MCDIDNNGHLDVWEGFKIRISVRTFRKNLHFNQNLNPEDDITENIWWQIFLMLSTPDSEYPIDVLKFLWKHEEPDHNLQIAKIVIFIICSPFFIFKDPLVKSQCSYELFFPKESLCNCIRTNLISTITRLWAKLWDKFAHTHRFLS